MNDLPPPSHQENVLMGAWVLGWEQGLWPSPVVPTESCTPGRAQVGGFCGWYETPGYLDKGVFPRGFDDDVPMQVHQS